MTPGSHGMARARLNLHNRLSRSRGEIAGSRFDVQNSSIVVTAPTNGSSACCLDGVPGDPAAAGRGCPISGIADALLTGPGLFHPRSSVMSMIRVLAMLCATTAAGCGVMSAPGAPSPRVTAPAAAPAAAMPPPTASSSVFRHDAATPRFEGYISGR